jgi:hypothetical protein
VIFVGFHNLQILKTSEQNFLTEKLSLLPRLQKGHGGAVTIY